MFTYLITFTSGKHDHPFKLIFRWLHSPLILIIHGYTDSSVMNSRTTQLKCVKKTKVSVEEFEGFLDVRSIVCHLHVHTREHSVNQHKRNYTQQYLNHDVFAVDFYDRITDYSKEKNTVLPPVRHPVRQLNVSDLLLVVSSVLPVVDGSLSSSSTWTDETVVNQDGALPFGRDATGTPFQCFFKILYFLKESQNSATFLPPICTWGHFLRYHMHLGPPFL